VPTGTGPCRPQLGLPPPCGGEVGPGGSGPGGGVTPLGAQSYFFPSKGHALGALRRDMTSAERTHLEVNHHPRAHVSGFSFRRPAPIAPTHPRAFLCPDAAPHPSKSMGAGNHGSGDGTEGRGGVNGVVTANKDSWLRFLELNDVAGRSFLGYSSGAEHAPARLPPPLTSPARGEGPTESGAEDPR